MTVGTKQPQRSRLPLDARRQQLLLAGATLFTTRAWDEVTMHDVAAAAGVSKALLYHYFPGKRDLYVEVLRAADEELRARWEPDPDLDPADRLRASLDAYLAYVERYGESYAAVLRAGVGADDDVWRLVEDSRWYTVQRVLDGLGLKPPDPHLELALRGWVGMVEATALEWQHRRRLARPVVVDLLAESLGGVLDAVERTRPQKTRGARHVARP